MKLQIEEDRISFIPKTKSTSKNVLRVDNDISLVKEDSDSWTYKMSKFLTEHPTEWDEHIKNNHYYSIIKDEFNNLTNCKSKIANTDNNEYKDGLIRTASACVLALLNA